MPYGLLYALGYEEGLSVNILMINPCPSGILKALGVHFPPLGLLYIAAYLEKEGHQVIIQDLAVRGKKHEIDLKNYDIVGISTDTTRHRQSLGLAKRAKANHCTVVMGGPHPGYVDEEILSTKKVDFIVHGEGVLEDVRKPSPVGHFSQVQVIEMFHRVVQ